MKQPVFSSGQSKPRRQAFTTQVSPSQRGMALVSRQDAHSVRVQPYAGSLWSTHLPAHSFLPEPQPWSTSDVSTTNEQLSAHNQPAAISERASERRSVKTDPAK